MRGVYLGGVFPLVSGVRSGCGRGELVDPGRRADAEPGEDVLLGAGDLGALAEGAGGAGEGADGDAVELAAQLRPGVPGGVLGGAGQQEASQQRMTWARIGSSFRWQAGRRSMTCFMSRQPRSRSKPDCIHR